MTTQAERRRKRPAVNVLAGIMNAQWALTPDALQTMITIARRENLDPAAIEMIRGEPLRNTHTVTVREGIATIPVHGPMFRYADFFSRISGATSYEEIATDFQAALDDPRIRAIVFDFDTPGGHTNGCAELARAIYAARGRKPIIGYVANWAASGGYWMACACDEVVCHETGMVGSIGVIAGYIDDSKHMEMHGFEEVTIVSSNAKNKDVDPTTEKGKAKIKAILDDLETVFIADVAKMRGVTAEHVIAEYGQGDVFVGASALARGMVDRLGNYEALHAELLERESTPTGAFVVKSRAVPTSVTTPGESMNTKVTGQPAAAGAATPPGARVEGTPPEKKEEEENPGTKAEGDGTCPECGGENGTHKDGCTKAPAAKAPAAAIHPSAIDQAKADERKRIADIRALGKPGEDVTIQACIDDPSCTVEMAAKRLRDAETRTGADRLAALRTDDAGKHPSNVAAPTDQSPEAAAKGAVKAYYDLTQPKGSTQRAR